jgi:curved DNA-binding protein
LTKDYYKILGVEKNADQAAIKKIYRQKALKLHPDRNKNNPYAEEQFKDLSEDYAVLSDPEKRKHYDMFGNQEFHQRYRNKEDIYQGSDINDIFKDMGFSADFFSRIFGNKQKTHFQTGPSRRSTASYGYGGMNGADISSMFGGEAKGADLEYELPITLEEAFSGGSREVAFRRADGKMERISIKVPQGVTTGAKLRLAGKGEKGAGNMPDGDLLIRIKVQEHQLFVRNQDDLEMEYKVAFSQAVLGANLQIPTLEGKTLSVKLAPGSVAGSRLRLKGQGMPVFNASNNSGQNRGDLFVKIQILVPNQLTAQQKELLLELKKQGL